jgi:predicted permease
MLKSFQKLMSTGLGYPTKNLLTMRLDLRAEKYTTPEARNEFARNLVEKTESLPGVESTLLWGPSDLGRGSWVMFVAPEGRAVNRQEDLLMVSRHSVNPDGLRNLGIPLVGGREFTWHDSPQTQPVTIISESLAKNFWPQENPIGKRIQFQGRDGRLIPLTIVGLAADARHRPRYEANLGARAFRPQLDVYLPYTQRPNQALVVALRTNVEPSTVLPSFKQAVLSLDPNLPVYDVTTLDERLAAEEAPTRAIAGLMTAYASLALFLAALGIYGVLAQNVAERRQEIGIRIALGAQKSDIMRLIVGGGMTLAVLGVVLGVGSSFALTKLMTTLLFGVESYDPLTFSIAPLALALVALIACWIPARRATKVDPITALREY